MKQISVLCVVCILCQIAAVTEVEGKTLFPDRDETVAVMKKVGDWQLANLPDEALVGGRMRPIVSNGWIRAAFFTGVMALYDTTGDQKYLDAALDWAEENRWQPAKRPRHADDHCVGQTYTELYFIRRDPKMIEAMQKTFDAIVADPKRGPVVGWTRDVNWWWCDALYMAPPALARLSAATGEEKYLDLMNTLWWDTTDHLYDTEDHLFFRDARYKMQEDGTWPRRSPNGEKIFWSRGNGWVMAGTARVLQYMPDDYPARPKYIRLFREMAEKVASIQGKDGLWRSSLLDPVAYPAPETSGSGFFCYALTWGINQGILERAKYLPVVEKAWHGLVGAVNESGKLGWVQQVGADPKTVVKDDTMEYGSGAFLLAGSEIVKLDMPVVKAQNKLEIGRPSETIALEWQHLGLPSHWADRIEVRDQRSGQVSVTQAVDVDSDGDIDELIFQSDFGPRQNKTFALGVSPRGAREIPSKVHAKFVPTRYDDFAWENDRIAFRMYGPALQHTDNEKERLTSSGIDVWAKRVRYLVLDKWYSPDYPSYHADSGEGLDFYKVGPTRGCGGVAIWDGGKMHASENYTDWKIIADGPIRTIFELTFAPWDVNGKKVSEVKRVTLDAGQNLNRFDSMFETDGNPQEVTYAVGIVIKLHETGVPSSDKKHGWLGVWEPTEENGSLGCGIVVDPSRLVDITEAEEHHLIIAKSAANGRATYYAGAGWDRSGDFSSADDWNSYLAQFAQRLRSPLTISVSR